MFAADMVFGTTSDDIRKRVEDEAKAENKKINEQLERLRNDMTAEIKLAEAQGSKFPTSWDYERAVTKRPIS